MDHRFQNIFRSMVEGVNTPDAVTNIISFALINQHKLRKFILPTEKEKLWNENELEDTNINPDLIDLLFDVSCDEVNYARDYTLIARMKKDGTFIYVALTAHEIIKESYFQGNITFSKSVEVFMKEIIVGRDQNFIKKVSQLLEDEDIRCL